MVAKFTRTITHTTALVKAIDKDTYDVFERKIALPEYFDNCDKALKACQKIMYAENKNIAVLNVIALEQNSGKYEMSLDTFLKYATKVD